MIGRGHPLLTLIQGGKQPAQVPATGAPRLRNVRPMEAPTGNGNGDSDGPRAA